MKVTSNSTFAQAGSVIDKDVAELIRRSADSNAALMRGDIDRYRALIKLTDDFTLMSPFGGTPTRGSDMTSERWEAMGRFFRNGRLEHEVIQTYASADMVVLVIVEHGSGEVGRLPTQEWPLRVTLIYRRDGTEWRLAHRHADPLAAGISLAHAAALARGEAF
jgi:ketosteroid isomerase-like protein